MTEKELHKLKRQEVLQLLLLQVKEAEQCRQQLTEVTEQLEQAEDTLERLKARLNSKDAQIHKLKGRLDNKDEQIRDLRAAAEKYRQDRLKDLRHTGSIAEAALQISGVFEAAQRAADLYLENIKKLYEDASEAEK